MLSDQNTVRLMSISKPLETDIAKRKHKIAPISSRQGILTVARGATFDFVAINL